MSDIKFNEVFIFVSGSTPQIITETIFALSQQNPPIYPAELFIITTSTGKKWDNLYHVFVTPEFETNSHFYYRPIQNRDIPGRLPDGSKTTLNTACTAKNVIRPEAGRKIGAYASRNSRMIAPVRISNATH